MIIAERLTEVMEVKSLAKGNHEPDGIMCVMEAASYIAGEAWSDAPDCVCPSITAFMVNWNDSLPDDAERNRLLKPLLPLIIGTRSTKEVEMRRRWMAFDWLVREHATAWMDLTPALKGHAVKLRSLPEITQDTIAVAMPILKDARAAAGDAAWDAAGDAAGAAAGDAAGDAAGAAARAAAGDAAGDAAWDAAWDAAGDAAGDAMKPTVLRLQESAQVLVRRMAKATVEA